MTRIYAISRRKGNANREKPGGLQGARGGAFGWGPSGKRIPPGLQARLL